MKKIVPTLKSGIMKSYTLNALGIQYKATDEDIKYDKKLLKDYNNILTSSKVPDKPIIICYNFPVDIQYSGDSSKSLKYEPVTELAEVHSTSMILSSHLILLRQAKTLGQYDQPQSTLDLLYTRKSILKHNKNVLQNLPLYKFYQVTSVCENIGDISSGTSVILNSTLDTILTWVEEEFPICKQFIKDNTSKISATMLNKISTYSIPPYFPPSSLEQFYQLLKLDPERLSAIINKIIFGPRTDNSRKIIKEINYMLNLNHTDVELFTHFKQYVKPQTYTVDRGTIRANEISQLFRGSNKGFPPKIGSYLDFGGGDGEISSAVAKMFKVPKESAYSADINSWMYHEGKGLLQILITLF